MKKDLKKLLETTQEIQVDISAIKVDLAHHIKRSDSHEEEILRLNKVLYMIYGIGAFIGGVGVLAGIYGIFK